MAKQGNQDHKSSCDSMPSLEDVDDEEYAVQGELMVARRGLSVQSKKKRVNKRKSVKKRVNKRKSVKKRVSKRKRVTKSK